MTIETRNAIVAIMFGLVLGFCSGPAPADEVEEKVERMQEKYIRGSNEYRDRLEAEQRQQERSNACYLAGENSAMCRAYGDPEQRRREDDRRRAWR